MRIINKKDIEKLCIEFLKLKKEEIEYKNELGRFKNYWTNEDRQIIIDCDRFNPLKYISDIEYFVNKLKELYDIELEWDKENKKWSCSLIGNDNFLKLSDSYNTINECVLDICLKLIKG